MIQDIITDLALSMYLVGFVIIREDSVDLMDIFIVAVMFISSVYTHVKLSRKEKMLEKYDRQLQALRKTQIRPSSSEAYQ